MKNKKFLSMDTVSVYNLTSDFFLRFVLYIFLFIFLYPAFTAPLHAAGNSYGHEYDLEKDFRTGAEHSYYNYNDKASPYLIYKVVSGEPIRYCLHIGERELKKLSYNDLSTQVLFAHNAWTQGIYDIIGNAGRDKEFDDFSSITPSVIKNAAYGFEGSEKIIRHTDEDSGKCDLFIIYDIAYCFHGYDGSPSYFTAEPMPQICLSPGRDSFNISTDFSSEELISKRKEINNIMAKNTERYYFVSELEHEMGHAFGLGDQYEKGLRNNDLAYSTVPVLRYSLMKSDSPVLTCDDADGFISLYYRIKKQDKTFQSLCNDGVTIENGKPLRNKNEWIFVSDIFYSGNVYTIGKSGKYVKHPAREIELISSDAKRVEQDKRMLDHFGFDLSYFSDKDKIYFLTESLVLIQGDKAQKVSPVKKERGVSNPVNLTMTIDDDGNIVYKPAADSGLTKVPFVSGEKRARLIEMLKSGQAAPAFKH